MLVACSHIMKTYIPIHGTKTGFEHVMVHSKVFRFLIRIIQGARSTNFCPGLTKSFDKIFLLYSHGRRSIL